jgi:nitrate reductase assembly molybdenum cofactor insertion protein NarJ
MQNLMFHFGTSSWGGVRKLPRVFTEQGAAMLSSVLKSYRAILAKFGDCLDKHDVAIIEIFEAIKKLMTPEEKPTKRIGFIVD